jgi:hypothetical protein
MEEKNVGQALKAFRAASKAAKVLQAAHGVALGCAAASLVVGGVRAAKKLREDLAG